MNFLKSRKSKDKNKTLPAREDDRNKGWSPSRGSWLDYRDSWWKRRSMFQKYLLFLTGFTGAFIITGIIEYRAPDLAMYILPESYRDFLHADMYNGSISPGLLIFVIGAVWFPLTPLMYGAVRKYRVQKRLQSPQQSYVYGGNYVTRKGEVVKSYGEKKIADYLYTRGIRYEYERPFYGYDEHGRYRLLAHPDFYIPDYGTVVEYFGMAGSSESYDNTARWKMERYRQNGIHAIAVFPRDLDNLNLSGSCNNTGELPTS